MSPYSRHRKSTGETPEQTQARLDAASHTVDGQSARVGEEFIAAPMASLATGAERVVLKPSPLSRYSWPAASLVMGSILISWDPGRVATEYGPMDGVFLGVIFVVGGLLTLLIGVRSHVTLDPWGVTWRGGLGASDGLRGPTFTPSAWTPVGGYSVRKQFTCRC